MWEILPGIEFASTALLSFNLQPSLCLQLAWRYNLLDWVPTPIPILLSTPLERFTNGDNLDFEVYTIIATAKESIATERKRLGNFPPFPKNFDDEPFCAQHAICKKVWSEKWFCVILRRIHHPADPLPLISVPNTLEDLEHRGMNPECKKSILTWLKGSSQIQTEETIIQATITEICTLFK